MYLYIPQPSYFFLNKRNFRKFKFMTANPSMYKIKCVSLHQNLEDSMDCIRFNLLIVTLDSTSFPSLLSILITIFFSKRALIRPNMAEHSPQAPTKIGSSF